MTHAFTRDHVRTDVRPVPIGLAERVERDRELREAAARAYEARTAAERTLRRRVWSVVVGVARLPGALLELGRELWAMR